MKNTEKYHELQKNCSKLFSLMQPEIQRYFILAQSHKILHVIKISSVSNFFHYAPEYHLSEVLG